MILGRDRHPASACFDELEAALVALGRGDVVLNAHAFPDEIPPGAVVYNLENVGIQVQTDAFEGHEIWDFSARNVAAWKAAGRRATHVPIGWHPSMERFAMRPWSERDIDVVFCGCVNPRRQLVIDALRDRGLAVRVIAPGEAYGAERDEILSRSKVALNLLFHLDGTFPVLRAAHAAANRLPMIHEWADEMPSWVGTGRAYSELVARCCRAVAEPKTTQHDAKMAHECFRARKHMVLPDPWAPVRFAESNDLEAMYTAVRGGPVAETPTVCIVVPTYRESERVAKLGRSSRNEVRQDLAAHGIDSFILHIDGDSLVCRMRQRACHTFLATAATHLLFWDADIACNTPDAARRMIATGHDVIAGACPYKDTTGRTVHNLWPDDAAKLREGARLELPKGCMEVRDAGTGFMLISRNALVTLQQAHPELLHWSMSLGPDRGAPLWALFDTAVVDGEYRSEDYYFCHLWQQAGGKVYVYVPARFTHYGEHGFEASFLGQYGLEATQ